MKRILFLSLFIFYVVIFVNSSLYAASTNPSSNVSLMNNQVPGVLYVSTRSIPYENSSNYYGLKYFVTFSAYGKQVEQQWYYFYRYATDHYTYNYRAMSVGSPPSDWDPDRYKYIPGIGFLDTNDNTLKGLYYADDPTPLCNLIPIAQAGSVVGYIDNCNNKLYDSQGNPVTPDTLGLVPFYSGGDLLGYTDGVDNWYGVDGGSNPMVDYVDPVTGEHFWQTPDGSIFKKNGLLWLLGGLYHPVFDSSGNFIGLINTQEGSFYNTDRTGYLDLGNDRVNGYVPIYGTNNEFLGFVNGNGQWRDDSGYSIPAPQGFSGYVPSSDSKFYSPFYNGQGEVIGWGSGTDYLLDDKNIIIPPTSDPDDPNPDPDTPDPNTPDNPTPDPPSLPDPPTPPEGSTVNQYNEITQNNDYSVTNNDNSSYNYNFNDTGTYNADGMFSDLNFSATIPGRISQRGVQLMSSVGSALGIANLKSVIKVTDNTSFGKFCINKPLSNLRFRGKQIVPDITVCLDFDELAQESFIRMIRTALLFMVFFMFVSGVFTVLRQY